MRHMHQVGGAKQASPFLSLWCSQTTCLPLMQEITGAKPVRDAIFFGTWLTGKSRPTNSESGNLGRAIRLVPTNFQVPPKHCQRCTRPVREF